MDGFPDQIPAQVSEVTEWLPIIYSWKPTPCNGCNTFGHSQAACPAAAAKNADITAHACRNANENCQSTQNPKPTDAPQQRNSDEIHGANSSQPQPQGNLSLNISHNKSTFEGDQPTQIVSLDNSDGATDSYEIQFNALLDYSYEIQSNALLDSSCTPVRLGKETIVDGNADQFVSTHLLNV